MHEARCTKHKITHSGEETQKLAAGLAKELNAGSVLALVGDLGCGKTCFVKGLARGLKIPDSVSVSSPTYVLIHEYPEGRLPLYHLDFYRLEKKEEALHLNLEEYFEGSGVVVVEWADKFPDLFPEKTHWIHFKFLEESKREISC